MAAVDSPDLAFRPSPVQRWNSPVLATVGQFTPTDAPEVNLPLESTRTGNVFTDRFNAQIAWYLPAYELAADIDAAFSFAAAAEGIGSDGNPYYRATLTLALNKVVPPDATAYAAANPADFLREIPLTGLAATLTTTANDPQTGQVQQGQFPAALAVATDGTVTVSFSSLLGTQVLVAYNNLRNGGASISLTAQFEVWRLIRVMRPVNPITPVNPVNPPGGLPSHYPTGPIQRRPMPMILMEPTMAPVATLGNPIRFFPTSEYITASDPFTASLDLATKYTAPGYGRSYTITDANGVRPIQSINDLKNFNTSQSEYSEFTALGDVSTTYPSFSRLYIGALSRTIVAVPVTYGILRGKNGTSAQCQALLDSTAGGSGACKFQFSFTLGAVMSPIDLFDLQVALAANPQSANCTLVLPERIDTSQAAVLSTPFQSSVAYTAGSQAHTFQLTVVISDGSVTGSAVANANLFLKQLSASVEPFLSGTMGIALDDAYPFPITAGVVVNFSETSGSDDISYSVDSGAIQVINDSPLDLNVSRYALIAGNSAPPESLNQEILTQQSVTLPDQAASPAVSLLVERTLALESPFTKDDLQRYVTFITQDVQNVNYQIAVVAEGVDFNALGIAGIDIAITLPALPTVTVPNSTLTALSLSANAQISLPIQYAISSLVGVIAFTVRSATAGVANVQFTESNDFVDQPVYLLQSAAIPAFAPPSPAPTAP